MLRKLVLGMMISMFAFGTAAAADTAVVQEKASVTKVKEEIQRKTPQTPTVTITKTATVTITKNPVQPAATDTVPSTTKAETATTTAAAATVAKTPAPVVQAAEPISEPVENSHERKISINLASRFLTLYEGNVKIRMYPVGVGKVSTPSPTGSYHIADKTVNPVWTDPDDTKVQVQSGENNPLGYRWMGFYGTYGIHGTNKPYSIGGYVSNGCIRMHEEDVEELYDLVSVGTPVELLYDRIVIDRDPDHTISYYIYPDGYGWQPLSIAAVRKALAGYGVDNFESDAAISDKINASDGEPTYVAKAYSLYVNRHKLPVKALRKSNVTYLPAVDVADAINLDLQWDSVRQILTSPYGQATGYVKHDVVYCNADDAPVLFHLNGVLNKNLIYELSDKQA